MSIFTKKIVGSEVVYNEATSNISIRSKIANTGHWHSSHWSNFDPLDPDA